MTGQVFGSTMVTSNLEYYPGAAVTAEPCEVVFLSIPRRNRPPRPQPLRHLRHRVGLLKVCETCCYWLIKLGE